MINSPRLAILGLPASEAHGEAIERLNNWEKELGQGITINEAIYYSMRFDNLYFLTLDSTEDFDLKMDQLSSELSELSGFVGAEDDSNMEISIANCLRLTLRLMCTGYSGLTPMDALWAKYLSNDMRFISMRPIAQTTDMDEEMQMDYIGEAKVIAERHGYGDFNALTRMIESGRGNPKIKLPTFISNNSLCIFQIATEEFLHSLGGKFTLDRILSNVFGEFEELFKAWVELESVSKEETVNLELFARKRIEVSFELTDVFIYLTHLATLSGLKISDLIKDVGISEYANKAGGKNSTLKRIRNNRRFYPWLRYMEKKIWLELI